MSSDSPQSSASDSPTPRWLTPICVALPLLLTLLLYFPICRFDFVNTDDSTNIFGNPHIVPVATQNLGYFWTHGYYELYMPITYTIWGLLARIAPLSTPVYIPGGGYTTVNAHVFHTTSLILHLLNVLLVFLLLRRFRFGAVACGAGALVFGIHPVQVESVAWATGMNNLTGGLFSLLALLLYVIGAQQPEKTIAQRVYFSLASLAFLLGLLSKPTAVAVPLLAAILEVNVIKQRPTRRYLPLLGIWVALAALLTVITHLTAVAGTRVVVSPLWARPFIIGDEYFFYLSRLLWPPAMTVDYGRSIQVVLHHWWGYATGIVPVFLAALMWRLGKRAEPFRTAAALFVAATLPTVGIIAFYAQFFSTVADRYLYLAVFSLAYLLATLLDQYRSQKPSYALAALLLTIFAIRTALQIPTWHDTFVFSKNAVIANPRDRSAQTNLGIALATQGNLTDALPHFQAAVDLKPDDAIDQYHLGATLVDAGDPAAGIPHLEAATRLDPTFPSAWFRLGVERGKSGRTAEAIDALGHDLQLEPNNADAHYILGVLLANSNRPADALPHFQTLAQRLTPRSPDALASLGSVLDKLGRHAEAISWYRAALNLDPANTRARKGLEGMPPPAPKPNP